MVLLSNLDFSLPLKSPIIIFSLVLFIILFAPIILRKIKVPHIIGLIIAGVVIGPNGLNLLQRDSSIVLFGTVGLLYIMFLAGLEIDLKEFAKDKWKIAIFGLLTFSLPLVAGAFCGYYILDYSWKTSILLGSMFSTHTLVSYPIVSRYGIIKNKAVSLTVGGTLITDIFALLILAIITGSVKTDVSATFWLTFGISTIVFVAIVLFVFPIIIRWFFKTFEDSVSQYVFVLAIVFLASFLAEAAGLEGIIGAFFAGLILNRFIPHSSPLMNRIEFVGNALFIPFFLIGVGMLVHFDALYKGWGTLKVAGVILVASISMKYVAAVITQKMFKLSPAQGKMIFGLSTAHAAATLAIVLVGYNIIIGETPQGVPIRLLDEDILNGSILLILVSCAISSFIVEREGAIIAAEDEKETLNAVESEDKILISLAYPETVTELVDFGLMLKPPKSKVPVYALNVVSDDSYDEKASVVGKKMMDQAVKQAAGSENVIIPLTRYDMNISNAIIYTIKEQKVTDILIGLHKHADQYDLLGPVSESIINKTGETIYIYKNVQPFNTLKRMLVVVPPRAEMEQGFEHWFSRMNNISKSGGMNLLIYADDQTIEALKALNAQQEHPVAALYKSFNNWEDFLILSGELRQNDLLVIISSRKDQLSYIAHQEKLPYYMTKYFNNYSFLIVYPRQIQNKALPSEDPGDHYLLEALAEKVQTVNKAGNFIGKWFGKRKK